MWYFHHCDFFGPISFAKILRKYLKVNSPPPLKNYLNLVKIAEFIHFRHLHPHKLTNFSN